MHLSKCQSTFSHFAKCAHKALPQPRAILQPWSSDRPTASARPPPQPLSKLQPIPGPGPSTLPPPWPLGWDEAESGKLDEDRGRAAHFRAYPWSFSLPWARTSYYSDTIFIFSDRNIPFWETKPSRAENEKDTKPRLWRKAFIGSQYNSNPSDTGSGSRRQAQALLHLVKLRSLPDQRQAGSPAGPQCPGDKNRFPNNPASPGESLTWGCWQRHLVAPWWCASLWSLKTQAKSHPKRSKSVKASLGL